MVEAALDQWLNNMPEHSGYVYPCLLYSSYLLSSPLGPRAYGRPLLPSVGRSSLRILLGTDDGISTVYRVPGEVAA
jgi:hypothetical protein